MRKETRTYKDWDGNERIEDFYFNLTRAECISLNNKTPGGLGAVLEKIVRANDTGTIQSTFEDLLGRSFGIKSDDGRRLIKGKDQEYFRAFMETPAYDDLMCDLISIPGYAAEFFNEVIPTEQIKDLVNKIEKNAAAIQTAGAPTIRPVK